MIDNDYYRDVRPKSFSERGEASPKIRDLLQQLVEKQEFDNMKQNASKEMTPEGKPWKWPGKWKRSLKSGNKKPDTITMFYLNIKGEIEVPRVVPIYGGNMIVFRNKVYEVDPRAFWTVKLGMNKIQKAYIVKEIDRRPVSNLDWHEIRKRGDATDSDEFLIKAAIRAQVRETVKTGGKWVVILIILAIVGGLIYFFTK